MLNVLIQACHLAVGRPQHDTDYWPVLRNDQQAQLDAIRAKLSRMDTASIQTRGLLLAILLIEMMKG